MFSLKDSEEYYIRLSEQPKRFDADSPVTNVFFDDTNGQVFTVRSGGVTGVTVNGMDESKCTSFRMADRGPIISIKFSPDHQILAIQRNNENQNATIEFVNFKDLTPTPVEYSHTCKWKSAKILGFVWPKANEITFVTDHGIELLQVLPEKKQLKSLKSTSFSGAWFSWCAASNTVLIAGNNGALLQPFSLNNSTITKLQKLELEAARPVVERDVFLLRLCDATWCAVFRHGLSTSTALPGPTEVWLMPVTGSNSLQTHILKTGQVGRFAVNVVDDLVVVHHQSSGTSQVFDILEGGCTHVACAPPAPIMPAMLAGEPCPMYSSNWVVFQPDYIIDARLGCLWQLSLVPSGMAHAIPKEKLADVVAVLLRRTDGKETIFSILNQLVSEAGTYLVQLSQVFDEINKVYKKWTDYEIARNTAGQAVGPAPRVRVLITQPEVCTRVLQAHAEHEHIVPVVTAYLASVCGAGLCASHALSELSVSALVSRGCGGRLRALLRRGALPDSRPLACQLLSLGHIDGSAAQLALDMMWRMDRVEDIVEVLVSWDEVVSATGAARQRGGAAWARAPARKLLAAAARPRPRPAAFAAVHHATRARPAPATRDLCPSFVEYYNFITSESDSTK